MTPSWLNLDQPAWNEERSGWLAKARVTAIRKMFDGKTTRAHTVTLEIREVDKNSAIYDYLVAALIDNNDLKIGIEKEDQVEP